MQNNYHNRAAKTEKRGRPSNPEILARGEPEAVPLETVDRDPSALPPLQPMRCLVCGCAMSPLVLRTAPNKREVSCRRCGVKLTLTYRAGQTTLVTRK